MIRVGKILFPTDFSEASMRALPHALYLARQYGAELHMLHAVVLHRDDPYNPAHHFPEVAAIEEHLEHQATQRMRNALEDRSDLPEIKQVYRRNVSAAPAIVSYAEEEDVDLIVMSTHGRRGMRHLLIGSVTEEVIRLAPCSVLSIRADSPPAREVQHVLAPTDFSEPADHALRVARYIADAYDAEVQLLHVLEDVIHPAFYQMGATSIHDLSPDIEKRAAKRLREVFEAAEGPDVKAEAFVVEGHAGRDIARFADHHGSDLIVISTHGLADDQPILVGSVAERIVRRSKVPVLVVKTYGRPLLDEPYDV